ncbi:MAG: hypothetical protein L3K00_01860 [Thermoplasmata archaeon]|nr:hypothetical protein [Thermoplasmata archaeon]
MGTIRLEGLPLTLLGFPAETITNRRFPDPALCRWDRIFLSPAMAPLLEDSPVETLEFLEDDNRSAILPDPVATLDGHPMYLSVKGVGSPVDPYSWRALDRAYAAELSDLPEVRGRLQASPPLASDRIFTGEAWLRGSPYGGQGLEHATTALRVSEEALGTTLAGFRIAPVMKVSLLPQALEDQLRSIYWYRKFPGRMAQELRLVPSNVRVYFHGKNTVGSNVRHLFGQFGLETNERALRFETNFVRSAVPMLTLFARTLSFDASRGRYRGLDFYDVWLDKDAVLAPDGTAFFVDLEGIEEVFVEAGEVREKIEDQVYRTLYEMMFAYEQIEGERTRRFGPGGSRRRHFAEILRRALVDDRFVRVVEDGHHLTVSIRNGCDEESFYTRFRLADGADGEL